MMVSFFFFSGREYNNALKLKVMLFVSSGMEGS
jgi:hypothetical protein